MINLITILVFCAIPGSVSGSIEEPRLFPQSNRLELTLHSVVNKTGNVYRTLRRSTRSCSALEKHENSLNFHEEKLKKHEIDPARCLALFKKTFRYIGNLSYFLPECGAELTVLFFQTSSGKIVKISGETYLSKNPLVHLAHVLANKLVLLKSESERMSLS